MAATWSVLDELLPVAHSTPWIQPAHSGAAGDCATCSQEAERTLQHGGPCNPQQLVHCRVLQANPGQMTHNELMLMYKKHIDPTALWECATAEEMVGSRYCLQSVDSCGSDAYR